MDRDTELMTKVMKVSARTGIRRRHVYPFLEIDSEFCCVRWIKDMVDQVGEEDYDEADAREDHHLCESIAHGESEV